MIPRIAKRGHSFKGAGLYYLHDKDASSNARVAFTTTLNLPTNDPEQALRVMAYTAMSAEERKANVVGAKQRAGAVFTFSLSWSPDEKPNAEQMQRAAMQALRKLGLQEHEALLVGHNDTAHPHIHVICNLVHPVHGTVGDLTYSQRKLQQWAQSYEYGQGVILCPQRQKNAAKRRDGDYTAYQEHPHQNAADIALLFEHATTGSAFITQMQSIGVTVARGDKGRIVIVDGKGDITNLARQLPKGTGKRAIEAKFTKAFVDALPTVTECTHPHKIPCVPPTVTRKYRLYPDTRVYESDSVSPLIQKGFRHDKL
jgi:Relaxase/Mobilisation nuclease domain